MFKYLVRFLFPRIGELEAENKMLKDSSVRTESIPYVVLSKAFANRDGDPLNRFREIDSKTVQDRSESAYEAFFKQGSYLGDWVLTNGTNSFEAFLKELYHICSSECVYITPSTEEKRLELMHVQGQAEMLCHILMSLEALREGSSSYMSIVKSLADNKEGE